MSPEAQVQHGGIIVGHTDDQAVAESLAIGQEAVDAGAEVACRYFRENVANDFKRDRMDPVSQADREGQATIVEILHDRDPGATMVAEENAVPQTVPESGPAWINDPIDGTNNFIRDSRLWSVSLAKTIDGDSVAALTVLPAIGDTYTAGSGGVERNGSERSVSDRTDRSSFLVAPIFGLKRRDRSDYEAVTGYIHQRLGDLRRLGSRQISLAMVACGEIDAAISTVELTPWDTVAGAHMVRAGGGRVTDLTGDQWRHDSDALVATNGTIHEAILAALRSRLD